MTPEAAGKGRFCLGEGRFHTCRPRVIHTEYHAAAKSFGEPGRTLCMAQAPPLGWPEVIARLTQQRMQAETCVGMIKSSKNAGAIAAAKLTYETTKPRIDGAIAGLTAALVEGGKPEALPTVRDDLETTGKGLKEICDAALATLKSNSHQKGGWQEAIATVAVEAIVKPMIDWLSENWPGQWSQTSWNSRRRRASWRPRNGRSSATLPRNSRRPFRAGRAGLSAGACARSGREGPDGPLRPPSARRRSRHAYSQDLGASH